MNYRRKLRAVNAAIMILLVLGLLWMLAADYGSELLFWLLVGGVVVSIVRFIYTLWRMR